MSSVMGNLYVIAAPSGTGKTSLVKTLTDSMSNIIASISHTTRPKRPAEIDGINYHFVDKSTFEQMIEHHDFLEYANVFDYQYGTSRSFVEKTLASGIDVILEIDWQGCQQIQKLFPACISIFILPPSLEDLSIRLKNRNQDKSEIIEQRLADVRETVSHIYEYDYVIINADFDTAVSELKTIVRAQRLVQSKQTKHYAQLIDELTKIS